MIIYKFDVTQSRVRLIENSGKATQGSINQIKCVFNLCEEYNGLSVEAVFNGVRVPLVNGECIAPPLDSDTCVIGVVGYKIEDEKYTLRISPTPIMISVEKGSYSDVDVEAFIPEPDILESYYNLINELVESGMLKGDKGDKGDKGEPGEKGEQGEQGIQGVPGVTGLLMHFVYSDGPYNLTKMWLKLHAIYLNSNSLTNMALLLCMEEGTYKHGNFSRACKPYDILELNFNSDKFSVNIQYIGSFKGEQGEQGEQGIQGLPGENGDKGDPGESVDVQINGQSIVENGVAKIPIGGSNQLGVAKFLYNYGLSNVGNGMIAISRAGEEQIAGRTEQFRPIVPYTLDIAVKAAMCDGKGAEWTEEEQAAARKRMGIDDLFNSIINGNEVAY